MTTVCESPSEARQVVDVVMSPSEIRILNPATGLVATSPLTSQAFAALREALEAWGYAGAAVSRWEATVVDGQIILERPVGAARHA